MRIICVPTFYKRGDDTDLVLLLRNHYNTMGNQQSNDTNNNRHPFGRGVVVGGGGALGLSRAELDKRCQPSG